MFPAKSEEFLTPITCVSLTFSGAKKFGISNFFPLRHPLLPLFSWLVRRRSTAIAIRLHYHRLRNFFHRSKGKCIVIIRRLDPVTAPPPISPRKARSVVPAPPKLFWEESKVAITLSSVERWGVGGSSPPPSYINPLHRGRQSAARQSAKNKRQSATFQIHFIVVGNQPRKDSSGLTTLLSKTHLIHST